MHRASPELEVALSAFAGFDIARAHAPKARAAQAPGNPAIGRRGRKPKAERELGDNLLRQNSEVNHGEQEPSPEQMV